MKYKLACSHCKKESLFSDRDADKYEEKETVLYEWGCPHCKTGSVHYMGVKKWKTN